MGRRRSSLFFYSRKVFVSSDLFFFQLVIVLMYWQPPWREKIILGREIIIMSYKSLKDFGVSAERLGSMCKRWMARIQRFVNIFFCYWCFIYFCIFNNFSLVYARLSSVLFCMFNPRPLWIPVLLGLGPCIDTVFGVRLYAWFLLQYLGWLKPYSSFQCPYQCQEMFVCLGRVWNWDRGVAVGGTLLGIDFLSLRLAWKESGTI